MGIVVAAIFGLAPGLLLDRLHARTRRVDKQQISSVAPGSTGTGWSPTGHAA